MGETPMRIRTRLVTVVLGTVLVTGTPTAAPQPPPQPVASRTDPAVDAYTTFVGGKTLDVPVDRAFVVAALAARVSSRGPRFDTDGSERQILSTAHKVRREIRRLQPISGDSPSQTKERWGVFVAVAHLVDDVARDSPLPGWGGA